MSACFEKTIKFVFSLTNLVLFAGIAATVVTDQFDWAPKVPGVGTIPNDVLVTVAGFATALTTAAVWNCYGKTHTDNLPNWYQSVFNLYSKMTFSRYGLLFSVTGAAGALALYNGTHALSHHLGIGASAGLGILFATLVTGLTYANKDKLSACWASCFSCRSQAGAGWGAPAAAVRRRPGPGPDGASAPNRASYKIVNAPQDYVQLPS